MNDLPPFASTTPALGLSVGQAVERVEDPRLLRGLGAYIDDIQLPGVLHAALLRSSVAHGRVRSIDISAARAMPGVRGVFTAAEVEAHCNGKVPVIPMRLDNLPQLAPF